MTHIYEFVFVNNPEKPEEENETESHQTPITKLRDHYPVVFL